MLQKSYNIINKTHLTNGSQLARELIKMTRTEAAQGLTGQIHKGNNSMGGIFIYEEFITGTVVKVNKKSIRVHMTHAKCTTNGKVTREYDMDEEATFEFWKTIENRQNPVKTLVKQLAFTRTKNTVSLKSFTNY